MLACLRTAGFTARNLLASEILRGDVVCGPFLCCSQHFPCDPQPTLAPLCFTDKSSRALAAAPAKAGKERLTSTCFV